MLVQLNRQGHGPDHDRRTVTDHGLPLNTATTRSMAPVVAVLGARSRVAALPRHLPAGWSLRDARDLDDVRPGELVLCTAATEREIRAARAMLPAGTRVVALVDQDAQAELVAAVLTAGADVCVRGGHPAILAGHLVACRRRQLADRWARLQAAAQA
jgi:fructose-1,6-bisphosphatase/sedoheptulose 1,7-bisphosphatase-like protein